MIPLFLLKFAAPLLARWGAFRASGEALKLLRPVLIGLGVLVVAWMGWTHVQGLRAERDQAVHARIVEQVRADTLQKTAELAETQRKLAVARMTAFTTITYQADVQWADLLTRSHGVSDDARKAAADLNRLGSDARRMLERASAGR